MTRTDLMAKTTKKKQKKNKRKKRTLKQRIALYLKILKYCFYLGIILGLWIFYCFITLPDIEEALHRDRLPATTIVAENGNEIKSFGTVYSEVVMLDELPNYVHEAVVSTEDHRFYSHFGFDFISFGRAMVTNLIKRRYAQGGSTISQQAAKNLFLTPKKNIKRKTQELLLAFWLEYKFSKEQILTLYLNRVYLGQSTYGIEAAAQKYFQKSSRDLNLMEAAIIAGMLKAPSRYNPIASKERAISRAETVLQVMVKNGYITQNEAMAALELSIGKEKSYQVNGARYFADMVYIETNDLLDERADDIYVMTTLDQDIQAAAEKILAAAIEKNKDRNVTQGAVVVLDYFGGIKAMVGGVDYNASQFNRATQALRQPGSSFKPIVYLTAFENGWNVMDVINDYPLSVGKWKPENYDKKYYGEVTLMQALTKSLNLATLDLAEKVGRDKIVKEARKLGIKTRINNSPSMPLGTFEVKVIDMAAVYATIAHRGYKVEPYAIKEIYSKDGYQLYQRPEFVKTRVADKRAVEKLTEILVNVAQNGTGKRAYSSRFGWAAGKTGTSQDYRDAWFVGFTDKYIAAVWVGNDDSSPTKGVGGSGLPTQIWKDIMLSTY